MNNNVKYKVTIIEWLVFISFVVLGLEELLSCIAIKLESSFDIYYKQSLVVVGMTAVTLVLFFIINVLRYIRNRNSQEPNVDNNLSRYNPYMWAMVVALSFVGIVSLVCLEKYSGNDLTLEYMNSVQNRSSLFSYNPLTGGKLKLGIFPKYKFTALPYFYACIARFLRLDNITLIWIVIPLLIFICYLAICYNMGKMFFPDSKARSLIFLAAVLILILTGDKWRYTVSHALLHEGWKGSSIVGCIVLPFFAMALHRTIVLRQRIYGIVAMIASLAALAFCRQMFIPRLWFWEPENFGHQAGVYFGALVILLSIRQKYPSEQKTKDGLLLLLFSISMLFPYNGLMYPAIAYVCCKLLDGMGKYSDKRVVILGGIITFMLAGTVLPLKGGYSIDHVDQVNTDIEECVGLVRTPMLVGPNQIVENARMYIGCRTPYGKNLWIADCGREVADPLDEMECKLYENINMPEKNAVDIGLLAKHTGCNIFFATPEMFALTAQEAWDSEDPVQKKENLMGALTILGWEKYIDRGDYYIFIRRNI